MTVQINGTTGITSPALSLTTPLSQSSGGTNLSTVPCFSAYQNVAQTLPSNVSTKIIFQIKEFDLTSAFDNVTNNRFQPNVAGYYQVSAGVSGAFNTNTYVTSYIYKNGVEYKSGGLSSTAGVYKSPVSGIVFLNGTTDYVEIFANITGSNQLTYTGISLTYFQACLMRGA